MRFESGRHRTAENLLRTKHVVAAGLFEGPVQNQGSMGACEGEGWSGIGTLKAKKQGIYKEQFSAKWVWNGARAMEAVLLCLQGWWLAERVCRE